MRFIRLLLESSGETICGFALLQALQLSSGKKAQQCETAIKSKLWKTSACDGFELLPALSTTQNIKNPLPILDPTEGEIQTASVGGLWGDSFIFLEALQPSTGKRLQSVKLSSNLSPRRLNCATV